MENLYYNIFKTRWGWFGLLGKDDGLIRTCLPMADKRGVKAQLLTNIPKAKLSKTAFSALEKGIQEYYEGKPVDFSDVTVRLDGFSEFQKRVLTALRNINHGKKISYGQLAQIANHPKAARAIGSVMAKNPIPLIIPCHRVIKADGTIGQFSAPGGSQTKIRMLKIEKQ